MSGGQPAVSTPGATTAGVKRKDNPTGLTAAEAIAERDARAKRRETARDGTLANTPSAQVLVERKKLAEQARHDALIDEHMHGANVVYASVRLQAATAMTLHQTAYASNPDRMTRRDLVTLQCAHNDIDTDSVVWNTTKQLADILSPRTIDAFQAALDAVSSGAVALTNVDCFLPVHRLEDRWHPGCRFCGFGRDDAGGAVTGAIPSDRRRKLSLLRMWAGSSWTFESSGVLGSFFHRVLLPTGLATRYNEACDCRGQTALDFLLGNEYWYSLSTSSTLPLDQAALLVACFPAQRRLNHTREVLTHQFYRFSDSPLRLKVYPNVVYLIRELKVQQEERARLDAIAVPTLVILRQRILMHEEEDSDATERAKKDWDNSFGRVISLSIDILIAHYADL